MTVELTVSKSFTTLKKFQNQGSLGNPRLGMWMGGKRGIILKNPQNLGTGMRVNNSKKSGTLWGQGLSKKRGIDGGRSPKNINLQGGDEGAIFGDFVHPIRH